MGTTSSFKSSAGAEAVATRSKELLRLWPLQRQDLSIDTRHGRTQVIACGKADNPPLLLFHPENCNSVYWLEQVQTYAGSHRVYAVDLLGEAGMSEAIRPDYKSSAYAEWIEDLYAALNIDRAALVGASLGAWVCLQFACAFPERVERLALISPLGLVRRRRARTPLARLISRLGGPLGTRLVFRSQLSKSHLEPKLREVFLLAQRRLKSRPGQVPRLPDKQLGQLYFPILMLLGGRDAYLDTDKLLVKAAKALPQFELIYRSKDGHFLNEYTREVDRFLVTHYAPD